MLALVLSAFLAGGCWDVEEINRRAIIIGVGLDTAPGGGISLTTEFPLIQELLPPTAGKGGAPQSPAYVITTRGPSAFQAVAGLQAAAGQALFAGQMKVVVIGAALARQGLQPHLDALNRRPEIPPQAYLVLTEGSAREILAADLAPKTLPAFALVDFFRTLGTTNQTLPIYLWQFAHSIDTRRDEPEEAFLPLVSLDKNRESSFFGDWGSSTATGWSACSPAAKARAFGLLSAKTIGGIVQVPLGKEGMVTYRAVKARTKTAARRSGGRIQFLIRVHAHGFLVEMTKPVAPLSTRRTKAIARATSRALEREMTKVVRHLQSVNSDVLNLGEVLRARYPQIWQSVDWNREFPRTEIRIKVDFAIGRTGTYR